MMALTIEQAEELRELLNQLYTLRVMMACVRCGADEVHISSYGICSGTCLLPDDGRDGLHAALARQHDELQAKLARFDIAIEAEKMDGDT